MHLSSTNLCGKRLDALINKENYDTDNKSYVINPNICGFYTEQKNKNLLQEPGIPELEALYKLNFNYQTGNFFNKLTPEFKNEYKEALNTLYEAYNKSNSILNKNDITSFSDILLNDYNTTNKCGIKGQFTQIFKGNESIFREYIKRIQQLINNNKNYNIKLVNILKEIFVIDKSVSPFIVTINPLLNESKLDDLIKKTRNILVSLYSTCENDFKYAIEIYNELINSTTIKSIGFNEKQTINYDNTKNYGNTEISNSYLSLINNSNTTSNNPVTTSNNQDTNIIGGKKYIKNRRISQKYIKKNKKIFKKSKKSKK